MILFWILIGVCMSITSIDEYGLIETEQLISIVIFWPFIVIIDAIEVAMKGDKDDS